MTLPLFEAGGDPGPNFAALLSVAGLTPPVPASPTDQLNIVHATTVVAIRCSEGVVMAGDRRATAGNLISHRSIEKVFPADRHSGVAIAGAAGPAMEMVRLFQLQLEHYEKVEGKALSLDGKANQLGMMVRNNLPAALQGFAVVPLFAGYDTTRDVGRLFQYDVTGGRYEEREYAVMGSGSLHAGTVIKLGYQPNASTDTMIDLAVSALYRTAEEDAATGGPDLVRGIYPVVAVLSVDGFQRVEDTEVEHRFRDLLVSLNNEQANTR
ncbi:MAG: proteasome subunit beta [Acidimicrobiia bacterium]|nr:proteasome subunit beta [Acidimicrobiia bacterium]MYC58485.1 proteasome subunit beta [Acidimicrobiia bacterium]MYG94243.1 proteasome subunit beta [Acidimicrobiia bacterium]MYI30409.1 proteasome subunit beta [Acidimicrobiia bacterium]